KLVLTTRKLSEKNFDKEIQLDTISKSSFLSTFHFHRLFKAFYGISPSDYLERIRIENSIYLMKFTQLALKDIAFEVGFKNQETFNRVFKKITLHTPSHFRKNKKSKLEKIKISKPILNLQMEKTIVPKTNYVFIRIHSDKNTLAKAWLKLVDIALQENNFNANSECIGIWNWNRFVDKKTFDLGIITNRNSHKMNSSYIPESKYLIFTYTGEIKKITEVYSYIYKEFIIKEKIYLKPIPPFEVYLKYPPFYHGNECVTKIYLPIED
ncbi:MAG TPA: AraC family transcriptional regulator, partial [Leptospiraceae bacterium]|nr:AraC family transcriptional regulator [Leptospiraceae bacterium]